MLEEIKKVSISFGEEEMEMGMNSFFPFQNQCFVLSLSVSLIVIDEDFGFPTSQRSARFSILPLVLMTICQYMGSNTFVWTKADWKEKSHALRSFLQNLGEVCLDPTQILVGPNWSLFAWAFRMFWPIFLTSY